ncbi:hypothetical protein CTI12_AA074410 [Artemisia annua]|uniref:Uncharacterized protein n=1 Tax=Artemisia annua TaxID=35608 RepID=A0A2U1Q5D9_ARTAN|nr:hypothetical protein CTI12_AA074410 [Artemisia annua]
MSTSSMGVFSPTPNHKRDRSMLSRELDLIFNQLVEYCYNLKNYSLIRPLKGDAHREYGDYVCLSVLEVSEELRKDPVLFDQSKPYDIAEKILDRFLSTTTGMNMINQESLIIRAAGIITFKLHGSWIAQMLKLYGTLCAKF